MRYLYMYFVLFWKNPITRYSLLFFIASIFFIEDPYYLIHAKTVGRFCVHSTDDLKNVAIVFVKTVAVVSYLILFVTCFGFHQLRVFKSLVKRYKKGEITKREINIYQNSKWLCISFAANFAYKEICST